MRTKMMEKKMSKAAFMAMLDDCFKLHGTSFLENRRRKDAENIYREYVLTPGMDVENAYALFLDNKKIKKLDFISFDGLVAHLAEEKSGLVAQVSEKTRVMQLGEKKFDLGDMYSSYLKEKEPLEDFLAPFLKAFTVKEVEEKTKRFSVLKMFILGIVVGVVSSVVPYLGASFYLVSIFASGCMEDMKAMSGYAAGMTLGLVLGLK